MKRVDIERLLQWAYIELAKSGTCAWSPWDFISRFGKFGTRFDDQFGSDFRLPAWFGDPHPDAKVIARAVDRLEPPAPALVTLHAKLNTRPKPLGDAVRVLPVMEGPRYRVIGKPGGPSKGKFKFRYYSKPDDAGPDVEGAYCPLRFEPTPAAIEASRAEYRAWRHGLVVLVGQLSGRLADHVPTGPTVLTEPWNEPAASARLLYSGRRA